MFLEMMTAIPDTPDATVGVLHADGIEARCAFGRGGVTRSKGEGDGCTPIGDWPLRMLYVRGDRIQPGSTHLETVEITASDGWCDAPDHPLYNQIVPLPFAASHEVLKRDDHLYDLMIPMGYNDDPIVPGKGSAIFFHLAHKDYRPTEGCVAISQTDMLQLLPLLSSRTILRVSDQPAG